VAENGKFLIFFGIDAGKLNDRKQAKQQWEYEEPKIRHVPGESLRLIGCSTCQRLFVAVAYLFT